SGFAQGGGWRGRKGHACGFRAERSGEGARSGEKGSEGRVRGRRRVPRKIRITAATYRDSGSGRLAWKRRLARRAGMLCPAPTPENDRGGAERGGVSRAARAHGRKR